MNHHGYIASLGGPRLPPGNFWENPENRFIWYASPNGPRTPLGGFFCAKTQKLDF